MNFGVCECDLDYCKPKVENLVKFHTFDDAYSYYITKLSSTNDYFLLKNLWIVYIENDTIIQFEQLKTHIITKTMQID